MPGEGGDYVISADGVSYFGLGESRLALLDWQAALEAFQKAATLGYSPPDLVQARIKLAHNQSAP